MQFGRGLPPAEQVRRLREACAYLQEALDELDALEEPLKYWSWSIWRTCQKKASKDLQAAQKRLSRLETK